MSEVVVYELPCQCQRDIFMKTDLFLPCKRDIFMNKYIFLPCKSDIFSNNDIDPTSTM